ncbi:hypothetical protein BU26DRAFT_112737 [Trematosphaeria pertusa]|uniref:Uncharacterized protein n=1 Tax=Trematosphaeria pertusa TaxID=390896 RepID=A0A6A6HZK8_9PLEO|nr:uncharacterized protein BU26DRAFT_112737 [Trematosphaeria pertusa]KAF2243198.1 hypothetical protein BU26DRAFT_112737 [Trematosphaeria pertusa]
MKEFRNFPPEDMKATMHAPAGTEAYKPFMTRHLRDERRRLTERRPRAPSLDDRGRSADRAPERQGQRSPAYIERSHNTDRSYSVYSRSLIRNPDDYSDRRNSGDDYWKQRALDAEDEVEELKDKLAETEGQLRRSRLRIEQLQAKTQSQEFEINQLVGLGPNLSPFSTQGDQPRMYSFQGGYSATFDRSDQRNLLRGHYSGRDDSPRGHHRGRDKSPRSPSTGRNGAPARAASLRRLRGPGKDGRAAPSLASRITREVDPVLERKKEELASKKRKLEELCAANAARDAKLRELKEARNCRRGGG